MQNEISVYFCTTELYDYIISKRVSLADVYNQSALMADKLGSDNVKDIMSINNIMNTVTYKRDIMYNSFDNNDRAMLNGLNNIALENNSNNTKSYYMMTNVIDKLKLNFTSNKDNMGELFVIADLTDYAQIVRIVKHDKRKRIDLLAKFSEVPKDCNNTITLNLLESIVG